MAPGRQSARLCRLLSGTVEPLVAGCSKRSVLADYAVRRSLLQRRRKCSRRWLWRAREGRQGLVQLESLRPELDGLDGGTPSTPVRVGLQQCRRLGLASGNPKASDDRQSRAGAAGAV